MSTTSLQLSRSYSSFSGSDIRVVIEGQTMGALQALSFAIQREKGPIYVMGRVDPLSFSRGKRGIAGTLVHLMLDRHFILKEPFSDLKFIADNDEIIATPTDLNDATQLADLDAVNGTINPVTGDVSFDASNISSNYVYRGAWYVDQIPPIDAVVLAVNEYGNAATMRIYSIEILNEGSGFSVDDMMIENQMTYVCRTILPWQPLGRWDMQTGSWQAGSQAPA